MILAIWLCSCKMYQTSPAPFQKWQILGWLEIAIIHLSTRHPLLDVHIMYVICCFQLEICILEYRVLYANICTFVCFALLVVSVIVGRSRHLLLYHFSRGSIPPLLNIEQTRPTVGMFVHALDGYLQPIATYPTTIRCPESPVGPVSVATGLRPMAHGRQPWNSTAMNYEPANDYQPKKI